MQKGFKQSNLKETVEKCTQLIKRVVHDPSSSRVHLKLGAKANQALGRDTELHANTIFDAVNDWIPRTSVFTFAVINLLHFAAADTHLLHHPSEKHFSEKHQLSNLWLRVVSRLDVNVQILKGLHLHAVHHLANDAGPAHAQLKALAAHRFDQNAQMQLATAAHWCPNNNQINTDEQIRNLSIYL